jgi:quinohemoprotein ethanol dehydrogenase
VVNRGVAMYKGRLYLGALGGRLIALDAKTGEAVWAVPTAPADSPYAITGAPRIAKGRVIIGNAGSEYAVRGYVSAYEAETGRLDWRAYTVPGDPSKPFESDAMRAAAATWSGEWWKAGGGGSPWDTIVYDPETYLVFAGTGNGAPGTTASAAKATTSTSPRSSRSEPTPAKWPGITRPPPATTGTTTPRNR